MAMQTLHSGFPLPADTRRQAQTRNKTLLRRLYDALIESQTRRAEQELARRLGRDFKFTDSTERDILRSLDKF